MYGEKVVSALANAFDRLRFRKRGKVGARFRINQLPGPAISAILDQLTIDQLYTLQRVNRKFRCAVNERWLLPRKLGLMRIVGDHVHNEDADVDNNEQIWMNDDRYWSICSRDRDHCWIGLRGRRLEIWLEAKHDTHWMTFTVSDACCRRFLHFFETSSFSTLRLDVRLCAPELDAEFVHRPVNTINPPINVAPLFCSFRSVAYLDFWPSSNAFIRHFQANYRCSLDAVTIDDEIRKMSDLMRCRECRMEPLMKNLWDCTSCTSMWNGQWLNAAGKSESRRDVFLKSFRPQGPTDILEMVDLAFCPTRPQQRGMLYVICIIADINKPSYPHSNDVPLFFGSLQRRIVTIYNGTMNFVDGKTDGIRMLKDRLKNRGYTDEAVDFQCYFQIHAANKSLLGTIIVGSAPECRRFYVVFVDE